MTRISSHHLLGASRRLPPRITLLASSHKYKVKEERKRILKLSVKKLRAIEDPEAFLTRSVLINNTLKRLQTEVREEKASKKTIDYNPSPYSFYSIEKAIMGGMLAHVLLVVLDAGSHGLHALAAKCRSVFLPP